MKTLFLTGPVSLSMVTEGLKIREGDVSRVVSPPYLPYDAIVVQNAFGYVSWAALRILLRDPPHEGHGSRAECLLHRLDLAVWIGPSPPPDHKIESCHGDSRDGPANLRARPDDTDWRPT